MSRCFVYANVRDSFDTEEQGEFFALAELRVVMADSCEEGVSKTQDGRMYLAD